MKNEFTEVANRQGWTLKELATVWEISHRQMSNVAKSPKRRDWLALEGLGDKQTKITPAEAVGNFLADWTCGL